MSNLASIAHHRNLGPKNKIAKPTKTKKQAPIKVVYISNPVKVKTSASQFMALVQRFTGQHAQSPDPATWDRQLDLDHQELCVVEDSKQERSSTTPTTTTTTTSSSEVDQAAATTCYDDDDFMMLENISGAALVSESFLWSTWMS